MVMENCSIILHPLGLFFILLIIFTTAFIIGLCLGEEIDNAK